MPKARTRTARACGIRKVLSQRTVCRLRVLRVWPRAFCGCRSSLLLQAPRFRVLLLEMITWSVIILTTVFPVKVSPLEQTVSRSPVFACTACATWPDARRREPPIRATNTRHQAATAVSILILMVPLAISSHEACHGERSPAFCGSDHCRRSHLLGAWYRQMDSRPCPLRGRSFDAASPWRSRAAQDDSM